MRLMDADAAKQTCTAPKANKQGYSGEAVCVEQNDFCSYGEAE